MTSIDDARILNRLERLTSRANVCRVNLTAPSEHDAERLHQAIRRQFGELFEVHIRVTDGGSRVVSVELWRDEDITP